MRTLLYIEDIVCTSLNQLKGFFKNKGELSTSFCNEILTLQRDGVLSLWLSEGDTDEEIQLSRKLNALSPYLSNTELIMSLTEILGDENNVVPKLDYRLFFDVIKINCYQDGFLVHPTWNDTNETIYKIIPSYNKTLNTFCKEIVITADLKIKRVDNESFNIQLVEDNAFNYEHNLQNHIYSDISFCLSDKKIGDTVCVNLGSFIVGKEPNMVTLKICDEVIQTIFLTKIQNINIGTLSLNMVFVKGGTFLFHNSRPTTIKDFYISETLISQNLWENIMGYLPSIIDKGPNNPVTEITFEDCQHFINKLNRITHMNFRIPKEEEWEYSAKGGNRSRNFKFPGSNNIEEVAIKKDGLYPIASKKPNELGLFDMSGLVWQWCSNCYSINLDDAKNKSIRGGSYIDKKEECETNFINIRSIDDSYQWLGVRIAIDMDEIQEMYSLNELSPIQMCKKGEDYYEVHDYNRAFGMFNKAAEQGYADAQLKLAVCYSNGEGVEKNQAKAIYLYRNAAEQGNADALFNLGACYFYGKGIQKDQTKAISYYHKAAELGCDKAQYNLGIFYQSGEFVKKDEDEAVYWLRKAAKQGFAPAQNHLGSCYENGVGIEKNLKLAEFWYKEASEQGDACAQQNLGSYYDSIHCYNKAFYWYNKAAIQGVANAQFNLGSCYYKGEGVTKNMEKAVSWFRKAAEQGHIDAQLFLGDCYANGDGVSKDETEAFLWYIKAAEQGDAKAQFHLGRSYYEKRDYLCAVSYFREAAEQGNAIAQYYLGTCYAKGEGYFKNIHEAKKWYRKAAAQGFVKAEEALSRF